MECFKRCSEVYIACPTGFIAFVEVQERRLIEGVFCLCMSQRSGALAAFRLLLPVSCFI